MYDFIKRIDYEDARKILESTWIGISDVDTKINATAYKKFYDESYLITISNEMIYLLQRCSDAFSGILLSKKLKHKKSKFSKQLIEKSILTLKNKVGVFDIEDFIKNSFPSYIKEYEGISNTIYLSSLGYIVAHEIGHHLLQHTSYYLNATRDYKICESNADIFAAKLLIESQNYGNILPIDFIFGIMLHKKLSYKRGANEINK